jgi:hemoglobin
MTNPTLFEWVGGDVAIAMLLDEFYRRAASDPLIGPLFAGMDADHPAHVAAFIAEVFGGPDRYSQQFGGHAEMIRHHLGRHLSEAQRRRWVGLLLDAYQDLDLPHDPEFASALAGYVEWGSRLAVINSQPGATVAEHAPMPKWGWGETNGPYIPKG